MRPALQVNLKALLCRAFALSIGFASSPATAATEPTLNVKTDVREEYYEVRGKDAEEVFGSIQRKGLGGKAGLTASGLTQSELSYSLSAPAGTSSCEGAKFDLSASVVVTLPRHAQPSSLTEAGRRHWEAYATLVEYHEYRHVEIEFQGLSELQKKLEQDIKNESIPENTSCASIIDDAIKKQARLTTKRHEDFHAQESKSVKKAQKKILDEIAHLEGSLHINRSELMDLDTDLATLETDRQEATATLEELIASHGGSLPAEDFERAQELRDALKEFTEALNETIRERNVLAERYNEKQAEHASLATQLSWTR